MRRFLPVTVFIMILLLAACASNKPQEPASEPPSTSISLVTNPDPAQVGDVELRFTVTDASGQPVSGADFDVFADHTDMAGMTMHGKATEQGNGVYGITANFSMAGNWKLNVQVKKGDLDYKQDFELQIQ